MQELITTNNIMTMSSLEISELTGKRHDHVLVDIRKTLEELKLELPDFSGSYIHPQNKQEFPIFNLPKRECLILISGYSIALRAKIIDRWQELENTTKGSHMIDDPIKRAEMWIQEQKEKQALALALENKTIELDQSKEWLSIKRVAKHNNIHWKLLDWRALKASGIAHGYAPKKVFDANFGLVNTYHRNTFKMIYPELNLKIKGSK